jgi:hypothetical protein
MRKPGLEIQGCAGRRPTCLVPAPPSAAASALGRYFAGLAHLESAAVVAFAILERELGEHDAPAELIAAARKALGDEVRHADIMGRLAQRFAAKPAPVELEKRKRRCLLEIALENATEGCVRETYGALSAHYQATAADDPELRGAWAIIAPEETEHAELAHALHRWLMPKLSEDERQGVVSALRETLQALSSELLVEPEAELVSGAGVPDAAHARQLYGALERELFSLTQSDSRYAIRSPISSGESADVLPCASPPQAGSKRAASVAAQPSCMKGAR